MVAARAIPTGSWPSAASPFTTADDGTVIRSKAVRGYAYRVIYTVEPDGILILAYAHERRAPGYWLQRLGGLTPASPDSVGGWPDRV